MKSVCTALVVASAGLASASDVSGPVPVGIASGEEQAVRLLAHAMLPLMPADQRWKIIEAGGVGSEGYGTVGDRSGELLVANDARYEVLRDFVSPNLFARMTEEQLGGLLGSASRGRSGETPVATCFAPGTDPDLVAAYEALFQQELWGGGGQDGDPRFQIGGRWSSTASSFSTGPQGSPVTLTYSYVPDGTFVPNAGFGSGSSQLFSWLNGRYGSPAVWQALFDDVFDRWGETTGVTYVYEPNDDGSTHSGAGGQLGVRGDVRIAAKSLDGNSGVLAYNFFPNDGDMVLDAFDSFFNVTSSASRRLRNVVAHEHGHGLGFNHVCPLSQTKLMEPFASTAFDMVQLDDIQAGQRNYGDYLEPNDSSGEASGLGSVSIGSSIAVDGVSIDDNSDIDFYQLNTTQPLELVVTASPAAGTYLNGSQNGNGSCSSGTLTNYNDNQDLTIQVRSSNGSTQVAFSNSTPAEQIEELRVTLSPGTYYVVIDDASNQNAIQMYDLNVSGDPVPFDGPTIAAQDPIPNAVLPGQALSLDFEVLANADTIVNGPDVHYRFDGGAFQVAAMASQGGDIYRAMIPAGDCGDMPEFYITVEGDFVGEVSLPQAGAASPFVYGIGEFLPVLEDDFETANGWSDTIGTASTGYFDRGVPVASAGAPPSDFDGSGQCYVTGNSAGEYVAFGRVYLRAPAVDLSDGGTISYAYWLSGAGSTFDNGDEMTVEISTNGQITWTEVKSYTAPTDAWVTDTIQVDSAGGASNLYFRFKVENVGSNNIVEAGVDAVSVGVLTCDNSNPGCNAADVGEPFGVLDLGDINVFVSAFVSQDPIADIAAPFGVFDLADLGLFINEFTNGCP